MVSCHPKSNFSSVNRGNSHFYQILKLKKKIKKIKKKIKKIKKKIKKIKKKIKKNLKTK